MWYQSVHQRTTWLPTRCLTIPVPESASPSANLFRYATAYDEYDSLDNQTLMQFKRIFKLLNIDEENKNIISLEAINKIVDKNKFIKLDKNEIIKYIHFLS